MNVMKRYPKTGEPYWEAAGQGPMRPIIVEANTCHGAKMAYAETYSNQVVEQENENVRYERN